MNTFRARLTLAMAAMTLALLALSGGAAFFSVRHALRHQLDETLLEVTQTEIESERDHKEVDAQEKSGVDESLLVYERATGSIITERGLVNLRVALRDMPKAGRAFADIRINRVPYRALHYPFDDEKRPSVALCVLPLTPLNRSLNVILLRIVVVGVGGAGLACAGAWWVAKRLTRPLAEIAARARDINEADLSARIVSPTTDAEIVAVTNGLNEMLTRLDNAFAAQRRFVSDAAHELRSPLANLRVTAEVALRRTDAATRERALRVTLAETKRLTALTANLLTLSRADAGELHLDRRPMDLRDIAAASIDAATARAEAQNVALHLEGSETLLNGDPERLRQVADNLLDNAIRHSFPGGSVTLSVGVTGTSAFLTVRDDGEGIAPENLSHLFDRFYRADAARARATGGYGLGLAISQAIARAHHGTLTAQSAPGHGAAFRLELPLIEEIVPQRPRDDSPGIFA